MLTNNKKYSILIAIDLLFSAFIWYINGIIFSNTWLICLILSTTTFLIIYTPFTIYWSIREIWFNRWVPLYLKNLEISRVKIKVDEGYLYADLVISKNQKAVKSKRAIIIVCSGFSDTKETLQCYYYPLAYQGYAILAYDARGIGKSKKTGKRSNFIKRINDFNAIVEWIKADENLQKLKIYCIGISVGALTVLCGGFPNKSVEKIVAISAISYYKQNILNSPAIARLSYYMKGINLSPDEEENRMLSPYLVIESVKNNLSKKEWKKYARKVMLIHSKDDSFIPIKNFEENSTILELSKENQLILNKGGHTLKKTELAVVGAILKFFKV